MTDIQIDGDSGIRAHPGAVRRDLMENALEYRWSTRHTSWKEPPNNNNNKKKKRKDACVGRGEDTTWGSAENARLGRRWPFSPLAAAAASATRARFFPGRAGARSGGGGGPLKGAAARAAAESGPPKSEARRAAAHTPASPAVGRNAHTWSWRRSPRTV